MDYNEQVFFNVPLNRLEPIFKKWVNDVLINQKPQPTIQLPKEYLTKADVAKMFSIDLSTVHNWSKSGKLKPLALSGRVYFLRSEVEASLTPLTV